MSTVNTTDDQTTTTTDVVEAEPAPPAWEANRIGQAWAVVEIFGHKVRAGSLSDAQIGGGTFLRVEHPTAPDHNDAAPLSELYSTGAIFSVRPCSRETATQWAETRWRSTRPAPALAELVSVHDAVDEDDDWARDDEVF